MTELTEYPNTGQLRVYDIEAISLPVVYNKYGDHDPNGMIYVLKQESERIRRKALALFSLPVPQPYEEVRPLVIRANVGDTIQVNFYNRLNRHASIHVQGLCYDVLTSDGSNAGYNPDTTTDRFIRYIWHADKEGVYMFSDMADTRSNEQGTNVHGLFGAIIVEAAGSVWLDPTNGKPLDSGLFADIYNPAKPAFREYAVFFHDELEIKNKEGRQPVDPHTGLPNGTTAISYRSEPMRNRLPLDPHADHTDIAEDISMSSWAYGDPATPLLSSYVGERVKIRLLMPADKPRNISFLLHGHRWKAQPDDPLSSDICVQGAMSVGNVFNIEPERTKCRGDYLYRSGSLRWDVESGMWGIFRVMNRNIRCRCETACRRMKLWWDKKQNKE